jgi:hypothetical protein
MTRRPTFDIWFSLPVHGYYGLMESALWILLPGFVAVASGLLAWFVMQSRMEVALAREREMLAQERGAIEAERAALEAQLGTAIHAAEEGAKRVALDNFLGDLRVEQRHYTRENRMLLQNRKSLVIQERMYFRNIPLSDWIEHEIVVDDGADVARLLQDLTVFDKGVVSIDDIPRQQRKALA